MVNISDTQMPWVILIGGALGTIAVLLAYLTVERAVERAARRRKGRAIVAKVMAEQPPVDLHAQWLADVDAQIRATAAEDAAEAGFVTPGYSRIEALLTDVLGRRSL